MPIIHDFTGSIARLRWVAGKRAYHAQNSLVSDRGIRADAIRQGLYLYLYDNTGRHHPIRNKNGFPGVIICPNNHYTVKSGKFQRGLHEHIRLNVHGHLWRPDATPPEDHIAPTAMRWFLVFETDPVAPAPVSATQGTREKYYNHSVRAWLGGLLPDLPHQPATLEHRWIPASDTTAEIGVAQAAAFLARILNAHPQW